MDEVTRIAVVHFLNTWPLCSCGKRAVCSYRSSMSHFFCKDHLPRTDVDPEANNRDMIDMSRFNMCLEFFEVHGGLSRSDGRSVKYYWPEGLGLGSPWPTARNP
jgi:hypothetical protein